MEHNDFASYDYADDAARANWGGTWRTPTEEEWTWLVNNCTWEWTMKRIEKVEYYGVIVTSNINGNSLYLPCAGYMAGSYNTWNRGDEASYWSSSLNTSDSSRAMVMFFYYSWDSPRMDKSLRCRGFSVRPVAE